MSALELSAVRKRYGELETLKGIDLKLEAGEFLVLLGPSGCGKSTLLNIVAGLIEPSGGDVRIGGRSVIGVHPKDRDIAMVFQSYALYPNLSVRRNIGFGLEMRGVAPAERATAIERAAALLKIEALLDRRPGELSGGQRQRVAIGRAIVRDPAVFLFDEPLSNLDAKLRMEMRTEIKRLHQLLGTTVVYVTHDQVEAMTLATRIAVMRDGRVEQLGTPAEIYGRPASLYVATFVGSPPMNTLAGTLTGSADAPAVRLAAGAVVPLATGAVAPVSLGEGFSPGRPVTVGLRPEALRLAGSGEGGARLAATIELVEFTGPEALAVLVLGEERITARLAPDAGVAAGEACTLAFDAAALHVFDAVSGARL